MENCPGEPPRPVPQFRKLHQARPMISSVARKTEPTVRSIIWPELRFKERAEALECAGTVILLHLSFVGVSHAFGPLARLIVSIVVRPGFPNLRRAMLQHGTCPGHSQGYRRSLGDMEMGIRFGWPTVQGSGATDARRDHQGLQGQVAQGQVPKQFWSQNRYRERTR